MRDGQGDNRGRVLAELLRLKKIADIQALGALSFLLGLAIAQLEEAAPKSDMRGPTS